MVAVKLSCVQVESLSSGRGGSPRHLHAASEALDSRLRWHEQHSALNSDALLVNYVYHDAPDGKGGKCKGCLLHGSACKSSCCGSSKRNVSDSPPV